MAIKIVKYYNYMKKYQNKIIVKTRKYLVKKIYHISKVTALVRRQLQDCAF